MQLLGGVSDYDDVVALEAVMEVGKLALMLAFSAAVA